jgi:S-(hydroxymethyl)glutathione dehydrogenase/alcohol dehydrogenase
MPYAAVMFEPGKPLEIHDIKVGRPHEREVCVRIAAAGVCHSDLSTLEKNGAQFPLPIVLGHEGSGVVTEVGEGVDHVQPGDHVILMPMPECGECYFCTHSLWTLCETHGKVLAAGGQFDLTTRLRLQDGELYQLSCTGTFAEETIIPASSAVKIDPEMPLVQAAVIGCAVVTGFGAATNVAHIRPGDTVAVIGCGGVGLNTIQGARTEGAGQIIAIDISHSKLDLARTFGATNTINSSETDPVDMVKQLTGGIGVAVCFEVVGNTTTMQQMIAMTRPGGQCIFTGIGSGSTVALSAGQFIGSAKTLKGNMLGMSDFRVEFPRLVELYQEGELLVDPLISETIALTQINDAFDAINAGQVARSVVTYD